MYRLVILALIPAALAAQIASPAQPGTNQPPGSVEGRVTNLQTGDAIAGATIRLNPTVRGALSQPQTTTSQQDGGFHFDAVLPGTYILSAEKSGFVPTTFGGSRQLTTIAPEQQLTNIALQMNPEGSISGKVMDEQGAPVPHAEVQVFTEYTQRGKPQLRRGSTATAAEDGSFLVKSVAPGTYYVAAEMPNASKKAQDEPPAAEKPDTSGLDFVRTFYPRSLDFETATPIEIAAGQTLNDIGIRLQRVQTFHIRGKIAALGAANGSRNWTLFLGPRNSLPNDALGKVIRPKEDGTFDVGKVVPGSYTLTLTGSDLAGSDPRNRARTRLLARQDVEVEGSDVNDLVLAVIPLINLTGRVTFDSSGNVDLSRISVNLSPSGEIAVGGFKSVRVGSNGSFTVEYLDPGQYMVHVMGNPPGSYVASVAFNRQDISKTGMDVTDGGSGEIDIVLRTGAGEVDGTINAGDTSSTSNILVALVPVPLPSDGSGILFGNAPPGGNFAIRNVPPGQYYAVAFERWTTLWQNPEFLHEMQSQGTSVEVDDNGHVQVQLTPVAPDQVQEIAARLGLAVQ